LRNGYLPLRHVATAVGDVRAEVLRIGSRDGEVMNFASFMVPMYLRRSEPISARAAFVYLKHISERDVFSVLEVVLGEGAKKLSASMLSAIRKAWTGEFTEWRHRDFSSVCFTYLFADGNHQEIRGDNSRICVQALTGVDA